MNRDTRIYVSSISAVTALFLIGVGVPCGLAFGWPTGIGLGTMCAFWGGPGFGVMVAGARRELSHEALEQTQATVRQPAPSSKVALAA